MGTTISVKDAGGTTQTVPVLPAQGPAAKAASLPVTVATDDPAIASILSALAATLTIALPTGASTGSKQDTGNTSLAAIAASLTAGLSASENHIGAVGGTTSVQSAVPATTTSAYASGNVVGGKLTFANMGRINGGSGLIQMASIHSKSAQTFPCDLVLFHTDPSTSTFTDHTALTVDPADFDKVLGVIHITDWTSLGTVSFAEATQLAMAYKVATGATTIYGVLVTRAAATLASTTDLKVIVKSLLD